MQLRFEKVTHVLNHEKQGHLVALGSALTPAEQRVPLGASMATQQQVETILGPDNETQTAEGLRRAL